RHGGSGAAGVAESKGQGDGGAFTGSAQVRPGRGNRLSLHLPRLRGRQLRHRRPVNRRWRPGPARSRVGCGLLLVSPWPLFEAVGGVVRGFVETPTETVDLMVSRLFAGKAPSRNDSVLDPGCGTGAFICGVLRWCEKNGRHPPVIVGVESDPGHLATLRSKFNGLLFVRILHQDFLEADLGGFDFVIGNPPYVPITSLSAGEKEQYRRSFVTARGRFD